MLGTQITILIVLLFVTGAVTFLPLMVQVTYLTPLRVEYLAPGGIGFVTAVL